jgi:hypothetical protein
MLSCVLKMSDEKSDVQVKNDQILESQEGKHRNKDNLRNTSLCVYSGVYDIFYVQLSCVAIN